MGFSKKYARILPFCWAANKNKTCFPIVLLKVCASLNHLPKSTIKSVTSRTLSRLSYLWLQCQRQIYSIFLSMHLDVSDVPSKTKSGLFCLETRVSGRCFGLCLSCECVRMRCFIYQKHARKRNVCKIIPTCKRDAIRDQRSLLCAGA